MVSGSSFIAPLSHIGINSVEQLLWFCIRSNWCSPMGILYFQAPSWCDLLALLCHPECPFLHHGKEGVGGVCVVPWFTHALKLPVLWSGLCIHYMLFQMHPLADLQTGGKQGSGFLPRKGDRGASWCLWLGEVNHTLFWMKFQWIFRKPVLALQCCQANQKIFFKYLAAFCSVLVMVLIHFCRVIVS